jgi:hypothetical protein
MQNAHERFGTLEFTKRVKDTTTRVYADRIVLEPSREEHGQPPSTVSMVGGDAEIGALWATVTEGASFHIQLSGRTRVVASLGLEAQCFRGSGSVAVPGSKLPVQH